MLRRSSLPFVITLLLPFICLLCAGQASAATGHVSARRARAGVLDFGETETARRVAERLSKKLSGGRDAGSSLSVLDRDETRAAARGQGYQGSLNLTLEEARNLGAAVGCDFLVMGEAQTLRRLPSDAGGHYEAYASIFLVSARTGRLLHWERRSQTASTARPAEEALLAELDGRAPFYVSQLLDAYASEARSGRAAQTADAEPEAFDLSQAESPEAAGWRLPEPFRRLRPVYPEKAARYEIEATVDALVEIDETGEVRDVTISRWAGYGLDEAVAGMIRQLHFRPATQRGEPKRVRVLLRYNFRRPAKAG